MQFQVIKGNYNNYILRSNESLSLDAVNHQLACFKKFDWKKKKVMIIAEEGKGSLSAVALKQINQSIDLGDISECCIVGTSSSTAELKHFRTANQLMASISQSPIANAAILMTGNDSGSIRYLERQLAFNDNPMTLAVDLDAIAANVEYYRNTTKPKNKVMAMVKANAYGHGITEVAHHLKDKVAYFGVAYVYEGIVIRRAAIDTPIMVMNPSPKDFDLCITYDLEPEIYSLSSLKSLERLLGEKKQKLGIHIEIDTGMNRLGIDLIDIDPMIQMLRTSNWIYVKGLYSHLACAEDASEDKFNRKQLDQFNSIAAKVETALNINTIKHVRNSAGTLRYPESPTDMVRLGIGLYGVDSNKLYQDQVKNISTLKTVISQIRTVRKGETIGYNRTFQAGKDMTIATIAIGYADGFKRLFSNGSGQVLINGILAPVVGRVNMDMTMVDVSDCTAQEGDKVVIFNETLTPMLLAKKADTIPYEIFTSVGERVKRTYRLEINRSPKM